MYGVDAVSADDDKNRGTWSVAAMVFNVAVMLTIPAMAILVAVSAEQYYNSLVELPGGLPAVEKITSVGQWGVWAATAVVVVATAINGAMEMMGFKKPFSTSSAPPPAETTGLGAGGTIMTMDGVQSGDIVKV